MELDYHDAEKSNKTKGTLEAVVKDKADDEGLIRLKR